MSDLTPVVSMVPLLQPRMAFSDVDRQVDENLAELCRDHLDSYSRISILVQKGLPIDHLTDFLPEALRTEWFVQEHDSGVEDAVVNDGFVRVPGHVNDLERRPLFH